MVALIETKSEKGVTTRASFIWFCSRYASFNEMDQPTGPLAWYAVKLNKKSAVVDGGHRGVNRFGKEDSRGGFGASLFHTDYCPERIQKALGFVSIKEGKAHFKCPDGPRLLLAFILAAAAREERTGYGGNGYICDASLYDEFLSEATRAIAQENLSSGK
ncbi:MAG: hypothetical protein KA271_00480 [Propionivibrio sp.]|nr:hypothetical protein [Propionivibrio sp.]